jgi:hypothetical protein
MTIRFRHSNLKDRTPSSGGPCILDDGTIAWAAMSDEDDGAGGTNAKPILLPIEVVDRRPARAEPRVSRLVRRRAKRRT